MEAKEDEDLEVPAERNTEFRHICGLQKCTLPTFILSIGSPLLWVSLPMPGRLLLLSLFFSSFFFFFFCFQTNCAVWRSGPTSDNVFFFLPFSSLYHRWVLAHKGTRVGKQMVLEDIRATADITSLHMFAASQFPPPPPLFLFHILQITGATICICRLIDIWGVLFKA